MAENNIDNLNIKITADGSQAVSEVKKTSGQIDSEMKKLAKGYAGIDLGQNVTELSNSLYRSAKAMSTAGLSMGQLRQRLDQAKQSYQSLKTELASKQLAGAKPEALDKLMPKLADAKGRIENYQSAIQKLQQTTNKYDPSKLKITGLGETQKSKITGALHHANETNDNAPVEKFRTADISDEIRKTERRLSDLPEYKIKFKAENLPPFLQSSNWKGYSSTPFVKKFEIKTPTDKLLGFQKGLEKVSGVLNSVSGFADKVSTKMSKIGRAVFNASKRFLSALNPMKMFNREQNRTGIASTLLGKAFSRLARMFRIMVTRMLIRGFISNIREGFQNIAQYSDEVNQKFSSIIASAKTLYNATASAFTPIIEALTPIITKALDTMVYAMNKVAEFTSALTGKSYFIKATKYQYDYAKSLDKSTNSTNKNSKATSKNTKAKKKNKHETIGIDKLAKKKKKNKNATIDIDKLNVIAPDKYKNANNGNGNGNSGANVNDMFDTKPVSKKIKDLAKEVRKIAKKLFEPIQEAWNNKGAKVLGSFKSMLGSIWETIKAIGRDFLTMWAQPQTEIIFEDILDTVATIFDIVKAISDQFRKAWNKDNVGLHIFENLRDVVGIVVKRIKKCAEYTRDWAQHLNFSPMLQSIERYTKSLKKLVKGLSDIAGDFYETVVLGISKWVVEKGLPNLIQVFTDFNNKVNWQALRKAIKVLWEGIEKLAESIGKGLINVLDSLMDALADLLNSKWFQDLIKMIGNLMKSIKPKQVEWFIKAWLISKGIKKASGWFSTLGLKIAKVLRLVRMFKYSSVGGKILGSFGNIGSKLGTLFTGLGSKIRVAFSGLGTNAGTGFVSSFKESILGAIGGGGLASNIIGGVGIVAGSVAIAEMVSLPYKQALKEQEKLNKAVEQHAKKIGMTSAYKEYLGKLTEANKKINEEFGATKEVTGEIINGYNNVKIYKEELDKIVDNHGNIKSGMEMQASILVDKINEELGTSLKIINGQVKGYDKINKKLEKTISLTTAKKLAEENAQNYYKAKNEIGDKSKSHLKIDKEWQKQSANSNGYVYQYKYYDKQYKDAKRWEKIARNRGDKASAEAYKEQARNYKKWRDQYKADYEALKKSRDDSAKAYRNYYRTILRQEAIYNAKTEKQRQKAIANYDKPLTKAEIKTLNTLEKISKATGESLDVTMEKYLKNGKIQFDKLPKVAKKVIEDTNKETKKLKTPKWDQEEFDKASKVLADTIGGLYSGRVIRDAMANHKIDPTQTIDLAKAMQTAYRSGIQLSDKLAEGVASGKIDPDTAISYVNALNNAQKNGVDISQYVGDGIFKNKKSVTTAINKLNGETAKLKKDRKTDVKIKGKNKYEQDAQEIKDTYDKDLSFDDVVIGIMIDIGVKVAKAVVGILGELTKKGSALRSIISAMPNGTTLINAIDTLQTYANSGEKSTKKKKKKKTKGYASGGFPKLGSEFIAGEKGAEFVGNINGKTGVASNQEITGIRDSIESSSGVQNQILMEQNNLLRALLEKNTDIVLDGQKVTKRVNQINARSGYKMAT